MDGVVLLLRPGGDRARPYAAQVNRGNVTMINGDWNAAYREELHSFPNGKYKDQVDASSRAFMVLVEKVRRPLVFTRVSHDVKGWPPRARLYPINFPLVFKHESWSRGRRP